MCENPNGLYGIREVGGVGAGNNRENNYQDIYESFDSIREDNRINGKYTLYEKDAIKGTRITIVDSQSGAIVRETK